MQATLVALLCSMLCASALVSSPLKVSPKVAQKFAHLDKLKKNTSWHAAKVPDHIRTSVNWEALDLGVIPYVKKGGCGHKVSAALLGMKPKVFASFLTHSSKVTVSEHPGRDSFAVPGAGADQVLKDDGMSTTGTVNGQEPFLTVLKDGFFEVGCYTDSMNTFADKFGNEKDKYNDIGTVSIARYSELVLKENQKPMTPTICFEFCRSLPNMVFFGITNGRDCYCEPYFKPMAGDAANCDSPCEGDTTAMCGSQKKSTVWEMHLCADTAQDLEQAATGAKEALDFFLEMAAISADLAGKMTDGANALKKTGGLSGAPNAADMGMEAAKGSKPLSQGYQPGLKTYEGLLKAYKDADSLKGADFTDAKETTMAEHTTKTMKELTGPLMGFAESMMASVKLAYPAVASLLGDEPDPADGAAMALANPSGFDYRQASYSLDTNFASSMSSCAGPIIDSPIVGLSSAECGTVCSATVYPTKCVAFNYYSVEGDATQHLCFLLSDIKELVTFECPDAGDCVPEIGAVPKDTCTPSALCMVKMSEVSTGYKPKAEWKKAKRCFGEPSAKDFEEYSMPDVGGKVKLLGSTELEAAP